MKKSLTRRAGEKKIAGSLDLVYTLFKKPIRSKIMGEKTLPFNKETLGNLSVGRQMPPPLRHQVEIHFNSDFSNVRIHEGYQATLLSATAFAVGNDIYLPPGNMQAMAFQQQIDHVCGMISHETSHTVQAGTAAQSESQLFSHRNGAQAPVAENLVVISDPAPATK